MTIEQPGRDTSSGMGGPIAVAAIALVAMGLLAFGYNQNKTQVAQAPMQITPPAQTTTGAANTGGRNADDPRPYQPANPAPDTRSSPTSSSTGIGNDNGGQQPGMK